VSSTSVSSSSHSSSSADAVEVGVAEMLLAISDVTAVDVGTALSTKIVGVLDWADDVIAVDVGPAE